MRLETQVLVSVGLVDVLIVAMSIAMDWTPLTNVARRRILYQKLDIRMWLFAFGAAAFAIYNLREWQSASLLYGGRTSWVLLQEQPIFFTWLGIVYSLAALMFGAGCVVGLAKFIRIWSISE
jgi:hypothetical protein